MDRTRLPGKLRLTAVLVLACGSGFAAVSRQEQPVPKSDEPAISVGDSETLSRVLTEDLDQRRQVFKTASEARRNTASPAIP